LVNADIESLHRIPSKRAVVKTTDKGNLSIWRDFLLARWHSCRDSGLYRTVILSISRRFPCRLQKQLSNLESLSNFRNTEIENSGNGEGFSGMPMKSEEYVFEKLTYRMSMFSSRHIDHTQTFSFSICILLISDHEPVKISEKTSQRRPAPDSTFWFPMSKNHWISSRLQV
jgi:hypothetical protein